MSTVSESRSTLETVLATGSLRVTPQGIASPPSVFVAPGTAWLTPNQLAFGRISINWVIVSVVSAANEAAIKDIDALAQMVMIACSHLPNGWGQPIIAAPGILTLGGLPYMAFRAEITGVL